MGVYCIPAIMGGATGSLDNSTNSTNDLYVIRATVYQVGIITNKTDDERTNNTGNQEALTFYQSNGSTLDLGAIPTPLVTNVTAQSVEGVAPSLPWAALGLMTSAKTNPVNRSVSVSTENVEQKKRNIFHELPYLSQFRRSLEETQTNASASIEEMKETALIPPAAGLRAAALPALVGLDPDYATK